MATPEDAAAGYRYFADSDATPGLGEINDWLKAAGFAPVSQRMYRHYQKLWRLGYTQYLTINRLDTRTVKDPVWDPNPRQIAEPTDEPIELRFDDVGATLTVVGRAVEVGAAGFVARVDNDAMADVLEHARTISPRVEVRFLDRASEWMPAELSSISSNQRRKFTAIRCTFERFGTYEELRAEAETNSSLEVSCGSASTALTAAEAAQLAFWLHETLEATRALAVMINGIDLPVARMRRMRFGSQWVALVDVALQHKEVFLALFGGRAILGVPEKLKTLEDLIAARAKRKEDNSPEFVEHRRRMRAAELRTAEATAQATGKAAGASAAETSDVAEADIEAVRLFGASYTALGPEERKIVRQSMSRALEGHDRLSTIAAPVRLMAPGTGN
jgi:hypothetical protein